MSTLADASALLWRLQFRNIVWVGGGEGWPTGGSLSRWPAPASSMSARGDRLRRRGPQSGSGARFEGLPHTDIARPRVVSGGGARATVCEALLAFARGDYEACVEWLIRVHNVSHRGSAASPSAISFISRSLRRHCVRRNRASPALWWRSARHKNRRARSIGDCSGACK